ncbi:hypothetical protein GCM10009828_004940 [Actinoplanes couchii]|uniref:Uncharacterized protein n=1 Tax=Actinoplanes couchii TaxID=403638 RepID=A0ABQ3XIC2_9ACTN|nr:hypothetical protein Aco03nite_066310 [Actinoplanes couchii]
MAVTTSAGARSSVTGVSDMAAPSTRGSGRDGIHPHRQFCAPHVPQQSGLLSFWCGLASTVEARLLTHRMHIPEARQDKNEAAFRNAPSVDLADQEAVAVAGPVG